MIADVQDNHLPFHEACALFEKQYIQKTLDECRGSVAKAANVLGINGLSWDGTLADRLNISHLAILLNGGLCEIGPGAFDGLLVFFLD